MVCVPIFVSLFSAIGLTVNFFDEQEVRSSSSNPLNGYYFLAFEQFLKNLGVLILRNGKWYVSLFYILYFSL
jgi:hypothetical protein